MSGGFSLARGRTWELRTFYLNLNLFFRVFTYWPVFVKLDSYGKRKPPHAQDTYCTCKHEKTNAYYII